MQYLWLCVLIASVIVEAAVPGLVSIWFVPASLISLILSFFKIDTRIQVASFLLISIILLVLSRTVWKKYISVKKIVPTNADALVGELAIVTGEIENIKSCGEVKVNGQVWSARSETGDIIAVGEKVRIVSIQGVKLICKKI